MSRIVKKSEVFAGKFLMRLIMSVLGIIALIIYLVINHYISKFCLRNSDKLFHWFPIVLSVVCFACAGALVGTCYYKNDHWTKPFSDTYVEWVYDPIGKTVPSCS